MDSINNWGYDPSLEAKSGYAFTSGINEEVFLRQFMVKEGKYGMQLEVIVGKDESTIKGWWALEDDRGGEQAIRTKERLQRVCYHFVGAYQSDENAIKNALIAAAPTSAEEFMNVMVSLLPANFQSIPASCILGYGNPRPDGSQFLELPVSMKVTGAFWSVNGSSELKVSDRITLVKQTASVAEGESEDEEW